MKTILQALRLLVLLTLLTGLAYPLAVTFAGRLFFPAQSGGSLVRRGGVPAGSALLAQKFESPRFFWPRPSAADYATVPSGASNLGPSSAVLRAKIAERRVRYGSGAPVEMLTASASGLDPHLGPGAAAWQAPRVAAARNLPLEKVLSLIAETAEPPQLGVLGEARVNVLTLNLRLEALNSGRP